MAHFQTPFTKNDNQFIVFLKGNKWSFYQEAAKAEFHPIDKLTRNKLNINSMIYKFSQVLCDCF